MRLVHTENGADSSTPREGGPDTVPTTEPAFSADKRVASRIVRRALQSRDVSLEEVGLVAGVSKQRVATLLDDEHGAALHLLVALAKRGGTRGRDVVAGVADQLLTLVDGHASVTGNVVADVAALAKELGEFAAAATQPNTDRTKLRAELVDLQDVVRHALKRLDEADP